MAGLRVAAQNERSTAYARFSDEEYETRWERTRERMRDDGYDAAIFYGTAGIEGRFISYLTNYL